MATKYVLIPEDMYRSLINDSKEKKSEIGIEQVKSELENIRKARKNPSVKKYFIQSANAALFKNLQRRVGKTNKSRIIKR